MTLYYLLQRFKEPSTYATITALLALFGQNVNVETVQTVVDSLIIVSGLAGVLLSESNNTDEV